MIATNALYSYYFLQNNKTLRVVKFNESEDIMFNIDGITLFLFLLIILNKIIFIKYDLSKY
jgi:hypothetical protein